MKTSEEIPWRPRGLHGEALVGWFHENRSITNPEGCWLFDGATGDGYGRVQVAGKTKKLHRLAVDAPDDAIVHHECGHRACFNPEHLEIVTHHENISEASRVRILREQVRALGGEPCA